MLCISMQPTCMYIFPFSIVCSHSEGAPLMTRLRWVMVVHKCWGVNLSDGSSRETSVAFPQQCSLGTQFSWCVVLVLHWLVEWCPWCARILWTTLKWLVRSYRRTVNRTSTTTCTALSAICLGPWDRARNAAVTSPHAVQASQLYSSLLQYWQSYIDLEMMQYCEQVCLQNVFLSRVPSLAPEYQY